MKCLINQVATPSLHERERKGNDIFFLLFVKIVFFKKKNKKRDYTMGKKEKEGKEKLNLGKK